MRVSDLDSAVNRVAVPFGQFVVQCDYRPGVWLDGFWTELQTMSLNEAIGRLAAGWDLTDGEGDAEGPYPVTTESISALPMPLKRAMLDAIAEDLFPNLIPGTLSATG